MPSNVCHRTLEGISHCARWRPPPHEDARLARDRRRLDRGFRVGGVDHRRAARLRRGHRRCSHRHRPACAGDAETGLPEEAPEVDVLAQARAEHRAVLDEYAEWEFNPEMLLRFPGLWDQSKPEVHRFFDALSAATLAEPEGRASDAQVGRYAAAVEELQMAWAGAERHARSTGTTNLSARFRSEADTGLKLYRHAQGAVTAEERQTYYRRALEKRPRPRAGGAAPGDAAGGRPAGSGAAWRTGQPAGADVSSAPGALITR
ncbi:hypothetical protein QP028_11205 [Corynebacterium suedekumii]|nr:hypothetical protein QP028_11205 [Corynebacterium suedekumii]